jgi:RimJ/RimL family protein N-acetyltransferase
MPFSLSRHAHEEFSMQARADDIATPRLVLRLMERAVVDACLASDLGRAGELLGVRIPDALLAHPSSLRYARARLNEDPLYRPWSARAMILPQAETMVGLVRFHSRPDPADLHPYARGAVEFGYQVFPGYQRQGYASEAVGAVMQWAQTAFGIDRFIVSVSPGNQASRAVIARFGFAKVGEHMDEIDGIEDIYLREAAAAAAPAQHGVRG